MGVVRRCAAPVTFSGSFHFNIRALGQEAPRVKSIEVGGGEKRACTCRNLRVHAFYFSLVLTEKSS